MKDIDFDELDKAVNSLMGGAASIKPEDPDPKTLTIATTLKDDEAPEYEKLEQAAERIGNETLLMPVERTEVLSLDDIDGVQSVEVTNASQNTATVEANQVQAAPAIVKRPAGRFMDVMHPSSDMKNSNKVSSPVTVPPSETATVPAPNREGIALNPFNQPPQHVETPIAVESSAKDEFSVTNAAVEPSVLSAAELSQLNAELEAQDEPKIDQPEPEFIATPQPIAVVSVPPQDPLVSPFLPDAKVEKRPLGGGVQSNASEPESVDLVVGQVPLEESDAQRAPEVQTGVSAEYHSDLMAIESGANVALEPAGTIDTEDETNSTYDETVTQTQSLAQISPEPKYENPLETTTIPVVPGSESAVEIQPTNIVEPVVQSDILPAGPQSIAQQYSELPDSGDKESGSIYDVNDYHKPVSHPAKTGSGWLWVVIIIVIIAICGGGAAAFYFLTQNA